MKNQTVYLTGKFVRKWDYNDDDKDIITTFPWLAMHLGRYGGPSYLSSDGLNGGTFVRGNLAIRLPFVVLGK